MAIAFDSTSVGTNTGTADLTIAHTCSGTDRILFVAASAVQPVGVSISGITYAGVAMTRVASEVSVQTNVKVTLFYLINPASGSNNIVITSSGSTAGTTKRGVGMSYTGARQSGVPDASDTEGPTAAATITSTVNTVADNAWLVAAGYGNSAISAGTGATLRNQSNNQLGGFDSNGAKSPAGSHSMTLGNAAADNGGMVMASFAPAVAAFTPRVVMF